MNPRESEDTVLSLLAFDLEFHRLYGGSLTADCFDDPIRKDLFKITRTFFEDNQSKLTQQGFRKACARFKEWSEEGAEHRSKVRILYKRIKGLKPDAEQGGFYFQEVREAYRSRKVYGILEQAFDLFKDGDIEGAERAIQEYALVPAAGQSFTLLDYRDDFQHREKVLKAPEKDKDKGVIKTGIKALDNTIRFKVGNLFIWAAQTSGGKSIALQDVAVYNAERKIRTVIVTNEMTAYDTAIRCDSRLSDIRHATFDNKRLSTLEFWRWRRLIKRIPKGMLHILEMPDDCSVGAAFGVMDEHRLEPELVIFDYANKMKPNKSIGQHFLDQGEVVSDMRAISIKRKCAVMTAVQIIAEAFENDRLSIADLSFAKVQISMHADFLVGILLPQKLRMREIARLQIMKARSGFKKEFIDITPDFDFVRIHSTKAEKERLERKKKVSKP